MVFEQVFLLLCFVALGFLLIKTKIAKIEHTDILSKVLVYIFLPANIFKTFALNFNREYIFANYILIIYSVVIVIILNVVAHFIAKLFSKNKYERDVYEYSLSTPNFGFVGFPLVEKISGASGLLDFMTFSIPVCFYAYTVGFGKLTKKGFSIKMLLNSTTISIVIGVFFGLTSIPIPSVIENLVNSASVCMGPVGMIMTGMIISQFDFKRVLKYWKIYPALLLRLIIIPLALGGVLSLFAPKIIVTTAILFYCLPCGLNTVIFPKIVNEDCETGASLAILSTIFSLITIPIICAVYNIN